MLVRRNQNVTDKRTPNKSEKKKACLEFNNFETLFFEDKWKAFHCEHVIPVQPETLEIRTEIDDKCKN